MTFLHIEKTKPDTFHLSPFTLHADRCSKWNHIRVTNDSNVDSDLIPTGLTVPWTAFEGKAPMGGSKVKGGKGGGRKRRKLSVEIADNEVSHLLLGLNGSAVNTVGPANELVPADLKGSFDEVDLT